MDTQEECIEDIVVVGGGDNGVLAALLLEKLNRDTDIAIIDDFDEEMPSIGKSTYSNVQGLFHDLLDIDRGRFFSEVKPVWKVSICFEDWCGAGPFHIPFDNVGPSPELFPEEQGEEMYYRYHADEHSTFGAALAKKQRSPFPKGINPNNPRLFDHHAYHLSISRFNEFLRQLCRERGIKLINDRISDVETTNGRIESIVSETDSYEADLYVDATGFNRMLMGELNAEFTPFDIPLDSALVSKTPIDFADIVPSTVVNSADYGWMWQIDTFDFRDLGYVYASDYVTENEAREEFVAAHDGVFDESDVIQYEFESGYLEQPWVENCVAVGNAAGFIEPLQATTLSFSAELAKDLSEHLAKHSRINYPGVRSLYNSEAETSWEELYSFIAQHYVHAEGDGEFWSAMRNIERNDRLKEYLESYRDHGFHAYREYYANVSGPSDAWVQYLLLQHLGVESEFYEQRDIDVRPEVKQRVENERNKHVQTARQHLNYEEVVRSGVYGQPGGRSRSPADDD